MQTDEFLKQVQERVPNAHPKCLREATKATLEALSYSLPSDEARRLAAQLPGELQAAAHVGGGNSHSGDTPTGVDALYGVIANRANVDIDLATDCAHAVAAVLQKAIRDGEISGVNLSSLPLGMSDILEDR